MNSGASICRRDRMGVRRQAHTHADGETEEKVFFNANRYCPIFFFNVLKSTIKFTVILYNVLRSTITFTAIVYTIDVFAACLQFCALCCQPGNHFFTMMYVPSSCLLWRRSLQSNFEVIQDFIGNPRIKS